MNIKALKKYNKSRRQYHKLLSKELGRKYVRHILYKARKIQSLYRLEANAAEEIEQELSVAAFNARKKWTDKMAVKKSTFIFSAINKHSAYLARILSSLPIMENSEAGADMQEIGFYYKQTQANAQKNYDRNLKMYPDSSFVNTEDRIRKEKIQKKERPKIKPSVVSCGSEIAGLLAAQPVCDNPLKMDIEVFFMSLTLRQQVLILLLEDGYTQEEMATMLGISQKNTNKQLARIRNYFADFYIF